jgi:hypothetical protein
MSEITKDFIKFLAEVIIFLMIIAAVFSPEGIASNTFNYMVFAEPILLQNYIATTFTVASQAPGEFSSSIKTSGEAHIIKIYEKDDINYVNVIPSTTFVKTEFQALEPVPFITDCEIPTQTVKLQSKLHNVVRIKKIVNPDGSCKLFIEIVETGIIKACYDGLDNDNDGKVDYPNDPGCESFSDNNETDILPQCSNGVDDDGDGKTDFPDDSGCIDADDDSESIPPSTGGVPQCNDGMDNDSDGLTDYPDDPGCADISDNDENNCGNDIKDGNEECDNTDLGGKDCTDFGFTGGTLNCKADCSGFDTSDCTSSGTPQCSDGIDNDGDSLIDFPADPGCTDANDNDETTGGGGGGGGGGETCLMEGTNILTPEGFKKIEDIKVGDIVFGYKDGKKIETKVLKTSSHYGNFILYYYKGYWFTGNHLVYTDYENFDFVYNLSNVTKNYTGKVYDIRTETGNYFGENGLLIHNKAPL